MRTTPILALILTLFAPVLAQAQAQESESILRSPLFWYWLAVLVIAAAVFAVISVRLSRRRQPPTGRGTP
ncbi:MAG TPA: hypothetical protein VLQ93_25020 [Myxococcaceae bacterium]|nr:hypothetical protein [Myxococcaceae bacterium]